MSLAWQPRGMTLLELVMILGVATIVSLLTLPTAIPWLQREQLRAAIRTVQTGLELDRLEALKRHRPCRFVVDTGSNVVEVWDGMGTNGTADDRLLHEFALPSAVAFAHPEGTPPVTFDDLGGNRYQVLFTADGTVASGTGSLVLRGGGLYQRLTLTVAGSASLSTWSGSSWHI